MSAADRTPVHVRARVEAREVRLNKLGYDSYDAYLRSPAWRQKRLGYLRAFGPLQCVCGATDDVQLHHKTYERVGEELLSDLEPLCLACHQMVHYLERSKQVGLDLEGLTLDERRAAEGRAQEAERKRRIEEQREVKFKHKREAAKTQALAAVQAFQGELARIYEIPPGDVNFLTRSAGRVAFKHLDKMRREVESKRFRVDEALDEAA